MVILTTTLTKMLELFLFIMIGYILNKCRAVPDGTDAVLSRLENNVLMPALIINTFITRCNLENLINNSELVWAEIIIIIITVIIAVVVAKLFSDHPMKEKIIRYGLVVPNFAFMGNALVESVFGNEMLYKYMILTIPLNVFTYAIGIVWLVADREEESGILKNVRKLKNPIFISLVASIVIGILEIRLPAFIAATVESAGRCMAPVAMILTGFIIAKYRVRELIKNIDYYVLTVLRLIIMPFAASFVMKLIGVDREVILLAVCALAMPFGLNTIIITAANGGDTKIGASLTLISHVIAVITIPIALTIVMTT